MRIRNAATDKVVERLNHRVVGAIHQRVDQQQIVLGDNGVTCSAAELVRTQPSRMLLPAPDPGDEFLNSTAGHPPSLPTTIPGR